MARKPKSVCDCHRLIDVWPARYNSFAPTLGGHTRHFNFVHRSFTHPFLHTQTIMKFKAEVTIMPLEALLDPQGKAVSASMTNIGLPEISGVRVGKHLTMHVEAKDEKVAAKKVEEACEKLLCNAIMEQYHYTLSTEGKK